MAYYLTRNSTKLSYLAKLVHLIWIKHGRKVIVFCTLAVNLVVDGSVDVGAWV